MKIASNHRQMRGIRVGQRSQNQGIDDAENCRVGADRECQRDDRRKGENRALAQRANCKSQILLKRIEPTPAPHLARGLLHDGEIAEFLAHGVARSFERFAALGALANRFLDMALEFRVELRIALLVSLWIPPREFRASPS